MSPSKGKFEPVEGMLATKNRIPSDSKDSWMSPLNKLIFFKAFRAKHTEVQISGGRQFKIDYDKRPGFAWISPIGKEIVPAGWFDLNVVTRKEWLSK
jgi:hypothetical protein